MGKKDFMAPADLRIVGSRESISGEAQFNLASMGTGKLPNGALVFVQSVKAFFQLDKASTATPDGITVVAAALGTGNWHRKPSEFLGDSPWLQQTSWFINAATGDDENAGSALAPLASFAELVRRLGPNPTITEMVSVYIAGDLDEVLDMEATFNGDGACIVIQGISITVLATDDVSVWQAPGVTGLEGQLTGTAIVDFSTYIGRRILIVDGTYAGYTTWISGISQSAIGNEIARVGALSACTGTGDHGPDYQTSATAAPDPGDQFAVQDLSRVKGLNLRSHRLDAGVSTQGVNLGFVVSDVELWSVGSETCITFDNDARNPFEDGSGVLFRCSVDGGVRGNGALALKGCMAGYQGTPGRTEIYNLKLALLGLNGGAFTCYNCAVSYVGLGSYVDTGAAELDQFSRVDSLWISAWHAENEPGVKVFESCEVSKLVLLAGNLTDTNPLANGIEVRGKCYYTDVAGLTITHDAGTFDVILGMSIQQTLAFGALPAQNTVGGGQADDASMLISN